MKYICNWTHSSLSEALQHSVDTWKLTFYISLFQYQKSLKAFANHSFHTDTTSHMKECGEISSTVTC